MNKFQISLVAIAISLVCGTSQVSQAAVILVPATATDAGNVQGSYPGADATQTINGSGLANPAQVANGMPVPASYTTNNVAGGGTFFNNFVAFVSDNATVTYTFANAVTISDIHFWQYSGDEPGRALASASILVDHGQGFVAAGTFSTGGYTETIPSADPGMDFAFSATNIVGIEFANLIPVANPQADRNGPFVGFSEIRFIGSPVPEPGTLTLACLGVAGLAWAAYKRRNRAC